MDTERTEQQLALMVVVLFRFFYYVSVCQNTVDAHSSTANIVFGK